MKHEAVEGKTTRLVSRRDGPGTLTDPTAHGGRVGDAFDLVLPSLPGYGFSGEPTEVGRDPGRIARSLR